MDYSMILVELDNIRLLLTIWLVAQCSLIVISLIAVFFIAVHQIMKEVDRLQGDEDGDE